MPERSTFYLSLRWGSLRLECAHIDAGPWQNGTNESFNDKFRDECLSMEWFRSRTEARVIIEAWRRHYNAVRPHSSLGYRTPNEYKAPLSSNHQPEPGFQESVVR